MYSLFIDTHDKDIIIALFKDGSLIDNNIKESNRNLSDFTMPMISEILKNNNIDTHDLREILVVNGPGSFTGVRIGVTIAKMLAYTLNIQIKCITSLEAFAVSSSSLKNKLVIIKDVKGVYGAIYTKDNEIVKEPFYMSNSEFIEYIQHNDVELIENASLQLDKIYECLKSKEAVNPHSVNPIYIKVIEALKND